MSITFLEIDRNPVLRLYALNEDGSLLMDLTSFLQTASLKFTDETISHEATFTLSNNDGINGGYFDKYGTRGGAAILTENRLIQFWKGFRDPSSGYSPVYYPAFVGRIADARPIYDRNSAEVINITVFDLLKLSLKRKFTSDPYYNTQLNLVAQDLILRYGDPALQLFGLNYATLNYLQAYVDFPDMTLVDSLVDIFDVPIYQFWVNYAGQPETYPKLGSSGSPLLGYPDATSPPTPNFIFPDASLVQQYGEEWQDHTFNNQVQVRGVQLATATQLGPSQVLGNSGDPSDFNFLAPGKGARPRIYYSSQTGNQNQLSAQNTFLKLWDPSFVNNPVGSTFYKGHISAGPYKYIASGPNITNDLGQIIPFPVEEAFTNFPAGTQGVVSQKSSGVIEGGISANIIQTVAADPSPGVALSPLVPWPPNFIDLFLWANSDGGGFEWAAQIFGQPLLTQQLTLTAIADYNEQGLTETLKDVFNDHQTYQGTKVPWAMGTPIAVIVNPTAMPVSTLSSNFSAGVSIITIVGSGAPFLPPTTPNIYSTGTTPSANVIAIGAGSDLEYAIVSGETGSTLTLSSPLLNNHTTGEAVQGLTGVVSYDDLYQSLLLKGDWDRGRIVFNNQTFRLFSADEFYLNTPGPSMSAATFVTVVDISQVVNPAPQAVYQSYRFGAVAIAGVEQGFSYKFTGLELGYGYTFRFHFVEPIASAVGQRIFDLQINGADQQTGIDIFALAGGSFKAYIIEVTGVNAEPDGSVTVTFQNELGINSGVASPIISGIEVITAQGQSAVVYAVNSGGLAVGPSPTTTLSSSPSSGTNSFTLTTIPAGFVAGAQLQIDDNFGALNPSGGYLTTTAETGTILSIIGSTVTVTTNLGFSHTSGAKVYLLPTIQATYGWSQNQQTYGPQALVIDDPLIQTLAQCQARANFEVNKAAWQRNQINIVTASVPIIKPGQVVKWFNPRVSTNGTDFWGYVQSIQRLSDRSNVNSPVDQDVYSCYLLYRAAR